MTEPVIRAERAGDAAAVRIVIAKAFGREAEVELVDKLRARGKAVVSLVAVLAGRVVGHVLFSPVVIEAPEREWPALGLAPVAVLPELQRQGIGTRLVEAGLAECRRLGHARVVVLGHPAYYRRFGFAPASRFGIRCEYEAPDEAFMALALAPGALTESRGIARFAPEFAEV